MGLSRFACGLTVFRSDRVIDEHLLGWVVDLGLVDGTWKYM